MVLDVEQSKTARKQPSCAWCGKPIEAGSCGRRRKYCSQACRQRAYEQRNNLSNTNIPNNAVMLTPDQADELKDKLFEVRCAAEDIREAVRDGATQTELEGLIDDLVTLTRVTEKLR
ncbi:hypothetical protein I6I10_09815 [Corynebacterium glucuronolyticum]|uniref:FCS-type domain-containing protein n=2 Tax=Corynebacterium glucuronolyticum TaxID=39791 RepID=A0A7T4EEA0_9CORY|nr:MULTISPECIES: hypothetical protein [Corynebacterium]MCT1442478.1 hypothetical protein [Corynebacterium glucuronolyticum]MCT1563941.1 hypothetical protein [Corynebacterium glucuronolyticum]OFO43382.1 hypothetical protein HMPREF3044_03230 [Corynebacterium sp. HMSC073D01]QQB45777.1 hypothetical protein I6I10_09815 [Corynebacterium glucuronolyticum]QQU87401.1 hypothetical protein I6I68_06900 [Corynebacterium glucuronolyticum]